MSRRFKFNEHGVCINPDRSAKVGKDTAFIEITTALVRGKWTYGIRYMLGRPRWMLGKQPKQQGLVQDAGSSCEACPRMGKEMVASTDRIRR